MALFEPDELADLQDLLRSTMSETYQWETPGTGYGADAGWITVADFVSGRRKSAPAGSILPIGDGGETPAQQWTLYLDSAALPTPGDRLTDVDSGQRFRIIGVGSIGPGAGPMSRLVVESLHA